MEKASRYYQKREKREKGESLLKQATDLAFVLQRARPGWGQWARRVPLILSPLPKYTQLLESLALD